MAPPKRSAAIATAATDILTQDLLFILINTLIADIKNLQLKVNNITRETLEADISAFLQRVYDDSKRQFDAPSKNTKTNVRDKCYGSIINGLENFKKEIEDEIEKRAAMGLGLSDNHIAQYNFRFVYYLLERYHWASQNKEQRHMYVFYRAQQYLYRRAGEFGLFYGTFKEANNYLNKVLLLYVSTLTKPEKNPRMPNEPIETFDVSASPLINAYNNKKKAVVMSPDLSKANIEKIETAFHTDEKRGPNGITFGAALVTSHINLALREPSSYPTLRSLYSHRYPEAFIPSLLAAVTQNSQNFAYLIAAKILGELNRNLSASYGIKLTAPQLMILPLTSNLQGNTTELCYIFNYTEHSNFDEDLLDPLATHQPVSFDPDPILTNYGLPKPYLSLVMLVNVNNIIGEIIDLKIKYAIRFKDKKLSDCLLNALEKLKKQLITIADDLATVWHNPPSELIGHKIEVAGHPTIYSSILPSESEHTPTGIPTAHDSPTLNSSGEDSSDSSPSSSTDPCNYAVQTIEFYTDGEEPLTDFDPAACNAALQLQQTAEDMTQVSLYDSVVDARLFLTDNGSSSSSSSNLASTEATSSDGEHHEEKWLFQPKDSPKPGTSGTWVGGNKPPPVKERSFVQAHDSPLNTSGRSKKQPPPPSKIVESSNTYVP